MQVALHRCVPLRAASKDTGPHKAISVFKCALCVRCCVPCMPWLQGGGAGARESLDDVDETAIWQEIQKRQKHEAAAAAAAGTSGGGSGQPSTQQQQAAAEAPAAAAAAAGPDVAALQQAAAERLPPEPAAGADSCRVAFRLPDGSRVQRNFSKADTVATLQVCVCVCGSVSMLCVAC